jgi:hypothetical protein
MKKEDLKVGDYFRSSKEARNEIASAWRGFVELKSLWKVVEILNDGDFIVECFVTNRGKLINSSPFRWTGQNIVEIVPYNEVVQLMLEL